MKKNIPTFQFVIDDSEESGVKAISIVGDPAFQSSMITFSKEKPKFIALVDKKMKQICAGLSLIPDVPICRIDETFGEYYGYFSKETIEKIVEKYHMEMNMNKLNLGHDKSKYINAFMIEDFIVDTQQRADDLKVKGIEHPNIMGSWYTAFKIKDKNVFESIINGDSSTGFSVEAYLNRFSMQVNNKFNKMKKDKKTLLEKIITIFSDEQDFARSLVPALGFDIEWGKPGEPVNKIEVDQNGNEVSSPVGPGEFATDAGTIIVDESSNLTEVRPPAPVAAADTPVTDNQSPDNAPASGDTTGMSSEESMKAYPWDTCISDQLKAGYSQTAADKICGWIKANNSNQEDLTEEVLKTLLTEEEMACKKKKLADGVMDPSMMDPNAIIDPNAEPQVSPDVKTKTIGDIIGTNDGEYWIKVCVEGGIITEAEVSSETNLMKTKLAEIEAENKDLKKKLEEPIGEPILEAPKVIKPFAEMSAYEKALYNANIRRS
jgi:hypothetical protein